MRNTPKNAVIKAKTLIAGVIFSNCFFIRMLYLDAKIITYNDIIVPIIPQIEMSLEMPTSDWKDE